MKVLREDITKLSKEKIKSFTTKADKANQMILSLEQKKDIKAMDVLEDMKKERATDVIVDQLRKAIAGTSYEDKTISELESLLERQFEPTLANILDKFKQYKTNLELEKNKNIANMQKEIKRFNWWSPFNYSAQNKETLDNKNLLED